MAATVLLELSVIQFFKQENPDSVQLSDMYLYQKKKTTQCGMYTEDEIVITRNALMKNCLGKVQCKNAFLMIIKHRDLTNLYFFNVAMTNLNTPLHKSSNGLADGKIRLRARINFRILKKKISKIVKVKIKVIFALNILV